MTDVTMRSDMDVLLYKTNASDLDVARAAWVSTKGEEATDMDSNRVPGLINYLMKDKHGSPFEHNSFTFVISCPIFVVREFHRHRAGWSYNEESGRYTQLKPVFYSPTDDRNLTQTGKPGHYQFSPGTYSQVKNTQGTLRRHSQRAWDEYTQLLDDGVAKEVARMVLPLNVYTTFWATCNARSLMHFLSLRTENEDALFPSHPQREIAMVADKMEVQFANAMPLTWKSWNENRRVAP